MLKYSLSFNIAPKKDINLALLAFRQMRNRTAKTCPPTCSIYLIYYYLSTQLPFLPTQIRVITL